MLTDAPIHPSLATSDVERSKTWYRDKLGLEPSVEFPDELVYEVGDSKFTVYLSQFAGTAQNTVMNWNVDDLASEMARLRGRGVAFEEYDFGEFKTQDGVMSDPVGGKTAWFKDPDGNTIAILQAPPGGGPGRTLSTMLAASDLERAKQWYADKLGFEPVEEFDGIVADYRSGDTAFNIYQTDYAGSAKNTVATWGVPDVRAEVGRLRARGVAFEEYDFGEDGKTVDGMIADPEGNLIAWFTDSDGNILALSEAGSGR